MSRIVHVVDDDADVLHSFAFLLESAGHAVRVYASAREFLDADPVPPGCLLLDVHLPNMDGIALKAKLSRDGSTMPVIMMSADGNVPMAVSLIKSGAVDFLEKPCAGTVLLAAVAAAFDRDQAITRDGLAAAELRRRIASLTAREREVMERLVAGEANKVVAHALGISVRTVEVHRARVLAKLEVKNAAELMRLILQDR